MASQGEFSIELCSSIEQVEPAQWQAIFTNDYPFQQWSFLFALEKSGSVGNPSGWLTQHILIYKQDILVAAMPAYLKTNSYGEYMFDWNWARAYQQHQINYYPKLVNAIPFTPASGQRYAIHPEYTQQSEKLLRLLLNGIKHTLLKYQASNFQSLFIDKHGSEQLSLQGLLARTDVQYHWFNRSYHDFDDFLQQLTSRRRKNIRKERLKIKQQPFTFQWCTAKDLNKEDWQNFFKFYQNTYQKRSGHNGYLTLDFFIRLTTNPNVLLLKVFKKTNLVAGSLFFKSKTHLYGRYWGSSDEHDSLHFEACYYQGIDYCIANHIKCFDAGAQGEHKLTRGFEPVLVHGNYLVEHEGFKQAITEFLQEERAYHRQYITSASQYLPYKST